MSLIVSAAAVTVVIILTPRGSTDKTVRAVASIFVISVIFAPFSKIKNDFPAFESVENYDVEAYCELSDYVLEMCRDAVETALVQKASELNVVVEKIYINANINTDGCIIIHDVSLSAILPDGYDLQEISSAFGETAGVPVTVLMNE